MQINPYDGVFYINQATSLNELMKIFEHIMLSYGFDQFAVQYATEETKKENLTPHYLCNFDSGWVDYYYHSKFYEIDPVILQGKQKRSPYFWSQLWEGLEMSKQQEKFFSEAAEVGVASGVGFPVFQLNSEPGIVSLVSSVCSQKEVTQIMTEHNLAFALLATSFHHAAKKLMENMPHPQAPSLTPREKECLKWAAVGKTDSEIGMILNISHRTVNVYMMKAYQKLHCVSREQAVVKALLMKLISI